MTVADLDRLIGCVALSELSGNGGSGDVGSQNQTTVMLFA
jgi:hypothetical protein